MDYHEKLTLLIKSALAEDMGDTWGRERVEGVMATAKTYLEMMPRLKSRIEDRTIAIPRNEGVLDDLRLIKLVKGVPMVVDRSSDKADGAKGRRHGDSAIALMNLVAAADERIVPIEFETLGPRQSNADSAAYHNELGRF